MAKHLGPGTVPAEGAGEDAVGYESNRALSVRATGNGAGQGNGGSLSAPTFPHQACEEEYQKIGWWKGPLATPEAREQVRAFWRGLGEGGIVWLARRVGHEDHVDILDGVANLLADLGSVSVRPILEVLNEPVSGDQAICLLSALRWLSRTDQGSVLAGATAVLSRFLADEHSAVRTAAVRATRLLPCDRARQLLRELQVIEKDEEVQEALTEELAISGREDEAG